MAKSAAKAKRLRKVVRVTVELPNEFVGILTAKAALKWRPWLTGIGEARQLDADEVLAMLVYMEARGAAEEQIHMATPMMWRDSMGPEIVHEERRVYEVGPGGERKLIFGPGSP